MGQGDLLEIQLVIGYIQQVHQLWRGLQGQCGADLRYLSSYNKSAEEKEVVIRVDQEAVDAE